MIIGKLNSEYYQWGKICEAWRILNLPHLSVIDEVMPPNTSEKPHFHQKAHQLFYIKTGVATFELNNTVYTVKAGNSFYVEPGQLHCIYNKTQEVLTFLAISSPTSKGDRIEVEGIG